MTGKNKTLSPEDRNSVQISGNETGNGPVVGARIAGPGIRTGSGTGSPGTGTGPGTIAGAETEGTGIGNGNGTSGTGTIPVHPDQKKDKALGWPIGIFIAYLIFVGGTLGFVFFTFTVPVNLVKADYYESTLTWQDQIDRVSRTAAMEEQVRFEIGPGAEHISVHFPGEHIRSGISGRIHLFRPSDYLLDREVGILTDSLGWQSIPLQGMQRGHWIMKVQWDAAGEEYYWQNDFHL